jgi:hypothetical protein
MFDLKASRSNFFDRAAVINAVDRTTRQVLSKFGAFVRQRAKTSIRKRKGTSPPGRPPYSHVGLLRKLIEFGYDADTKSVVIGPKLSSRPTGAPKTLEYGGTATVTDFKTKKSRRVKIAQRPYMGPAFEAEKPGLPAMWANSVR